MKSKFHNFCFGQLNHRMPSFKPFWKLIVVAGTILGTLAISDAAPIRKGIEPLRQQEALPCDPVSLRLGENVDHELSPAGVHCYSVFASTGQFLRVVVMQDGIDVVVKVKAPNGQQILEVDSPNSRDGPEPVSIIAESTGTFTLEVRSWEKEGPVGHYQISLTDLRLPTVLDRQRVDVERTLVEAQQLHAQEKKESLLAALEKYNHALPILRAIGDRWKEAETLTVIGRVYFLLGEFQEARKYLIDALAMWRSFDNSVARIAEATTLNGVGGTYSGSGQFQKGLQYREQALALYRKIGNLWGEAYTLRDLGNLYIHIDHQKSLDYMSRAVSIARQIRSRRLEGQVLTYLGILSTNYGEPAMALEYSNQALQVQRAIGDQWMQARSLSVIGQVYLKTGEPQQALSYLDSSLTIHRSTGNKLDESYTLAELGDAYLKLGDIDTAGNYFTRALSIARTLQNPPAEIYVLYSFADLSKMTGDNQKALEYLNQVLSVEQRLGRPDSGKALAFAQIGTVNFSLGKTEIAFTSLQEALRLYRANKNQIGEAFTLCKIAEIQLAENDLESSLRLLQNALSLYRVNSEPWGETLALYGMAKVRRKMGRLGPAEDDIETAINLIERIRHRIYDQELRTSFAASNRKYYELQLQILMDMHRSTPTAGYDRTALEISERARARTLLETLHESNADIREGVDPELLKRERSLQQRLNAKAEYLARLSDGTHTLEEQARAKEELDLALNQYREIEAEIRIKSPHYAALMQPRSISAKEIQEQVLDENTVLLEYALGEESSYLFVVTPNSVKGFELAKRDEIEKEAKQVYDLLLNKADGLYPEALARLSKTLLGPVANELSNKRLVIVTNGALQYVPFGALPDPDKLLQPGRSVRFQPLVLRHEIITLPSASVLSVQRQEIQKRKDAQKRLIVFADPVFSKTDPRVAGILAHRSNNERAKDNSLPFKSSMERSASDLGITEFERLPFSRREAELITDHIPKQDYTTIVDFGANHRAATNPDLSNYQIIHFATHGLLNNQHPDLSGVVLSLVDEQGQSQNGFLRLNEIYNLKLNADLVTLSACQTALGKDVDGEGLIGLARGFMYAGSRRVLASLWKVNDKATAELMKRFYEKMLRDKLSPSTALQAAQISMMKEKQWAAPYFWAGFVIQGDWK